MNQSVIKKKVPLPKIRGGQVELKDHMYANLNQEAVIKRQFAIQQI